MAASGRNINISTATFTSGNTVTSITTIQSVAIGKRGKEVQAWGDADFFPTLSVTVGAAPMVTVQHQNTGLLNVLNEKSTGTFAWTANDAVNGTGTGAVTFTLANANVVHHESSNPHQAVSTCSLVMSAHSTDGTTSPLTQSIAS